MEYRYFRQVSVTRCFNFNKYVRIERELVLWVGNVTAMSAVGLWMPVVLLPVDTAGKKDDLDWTAVPY
jgi:hypothetical protein